MVIQAGCFRFIFCFFNPDSNILVWGKVDMMYGHLLTGVAFVFLITGCTPDEFFNQNEKDEAAADEPITDTEKRFPEVRKIEFTDDSSGGIQVTIFHAEVDSGFEFDIFFSRNEGESWQPVRIRQQETHTIPIQPGGETIFIWERVKDLGLRKTAPVQMRVIPANSEWTGDAFITTDPQITSPRATITLKEY